MFFINSKQENQIQINEPYGASQKDGRKIRLFCFGNFFSINFLTKRNSNKKNVGVTDCSNSRKTFRERH